MARILALTARLPFPPREGHQLRSWHVLRALAAAHEVSLLSFVRHDDEPRHCAPLRDMLRHLELFALPAQQTPRLLAALLRGTLGQQPFVAHKYASAALRDRVAALACDADLIHVDMLPLCVNVPRTCGLPLILNAHNVEHELLRQRAAIETRPAQRLFLRTQVGRLERFERAACRRAAHILACSADDAAQLSVLAPDTPLSVAPNGVDAEACQPSARTFAQPPQLVFVGQMGWFPNRDGVRWFLDDVLPRIVAAHPQLQFVLIGKSHGLSVPARLRANVRLAGFVEDLGPLLHAAAVYVVPLRSGSGTRLKVLEAMAFGKAIVTTHIGAEGIDLQHEREALFADDAAAFAAAVLRLIEDPRRAAQLGRAARAKAQACYDWTAIGRGIVAAIDDVLALSARQPASDTTPHPPARVSLLPS